MPLTEVHRIKIVVLFKIFGKTEAKLIKPSK